MSPVPQTGSGTGTASASVSPTDIAGLQFWVKADAGTSSTVDNTALSSWNDQSGNARNLSQGTGANQPTFQTNEINGLPVVRFDGSNDFMDSTVWSVSQPTTMFLVMRSAAAGNGSNRNIVDEVTTREVIGLNASNAYILFAGSTITSGTSDDNAAHSLSAVFDGASSQLWRDGSSILTGNPGTNGLNTLRIGIDTGGVASPYNGDIGEIIIYNSALSAGNRQAIESYLRGRWATP